MATTVAPRDRNGPASRLKSPPLNRPPIIATNPASKLSMARRAASTFVALESFTNRTPPIVVTGSNACSRPLNDSTAVVIASALMPASLATAAAAITSPIKCRPISRIEDSGTSGVSYPGRVSAMAPERIAMRADTAPSSENIRRPALASLASAITCGSSALMTAQSFSVWLAKILAFARAYSSNVACLSKWSGDRFRKTATHGWNVSIVSS